MITKTKIRQGSIMLPKEVRERWKGVEVLMQPTDNTIVIKRSAGGVFWDTWARKMKKLGGKVQQKDIDEAVRWSRKRSK